MTQEIADHSCMRTTALLHTKGGPNPEQFREGVPPCTPMYPHVPPLVTLNSETTGASWTDIEREGILPGSRTAGEASNKFQVMTRLASTGFKQPWNFGN